MSFFYAYINSDNIVTGVYAMPTPITIDGYIPITQDQYENGNLVGKMYDASTGQFVTPPAWACSSDNVQYKTTTTTLSDKLDEIETSIDSKANTSDLHQHINKAVLDGITFAKVEAWDNAVQGADGASAYEIAVEHGYEGSETDWLASLHGADGTNGTNGEDGIDGINGNDGADGASAYQIALNNGFEGSETAWLASLKGDTGETGATGQNGLNGTTVVVGTTTTLNAGESASVSGTLSAETNTLTLNFAIPKGEAGESGSSASITADEVLTKIKTVDGAESGLDADMLDGIHASGFATANHTHNDYATTEDLSAIEAALAGKANTNHTHSEYATVSDMETLETTVNGKANANHTHSEYASVSHTHTNYATTEALNALATTVDGKANAVHTHSGYASTADITTLQTALNGKANINHTHSEYASVDHVHSQYANADDVEALETSISGKANATHTHTKTDITGLNDDLSALADDIADANTAIAGKAEATHTHTLDDVSETTTKKIFTADEKTKLSGIATGANKTVVDTAMSSTSTNPVQNKTVNSALGNKVDKVTGKGLSTNDYTTDEKTKLAGIATGANKYTHPTSHPATMITGLADVATSGSYNDLSDKPTSMTPKAHTHSQSDVTGLTTALSGKANSSHTHSLSDITETTSKKIMTAAERTKLSGVAENANCYTHPVSHPASMITGLAGVATSGDYNELDNKPTIPTTLPANGGNADTVDNKHAYDFATANHTHTAADIGAATADHTHSNYVSFNDVYPVGCIYLSVNDTNPSTLFGGTWTPFATGRVLCGVPVNGEAETTGGSNTATIAAHKHTTASHKLTVTEMPAHHHEMLNYNENGITTDTFTKNSVEGLIKKGWTGNVMTSYSGGNQAHSHGDTGSAGAATISVVQPYITCYMWKRIS